MGRLAERIREFLRNASGSILVETAFAMPLLVLVILGGVEVSRYVLLNQKLDRVAASIGDLIAQAETISATDVDNLFQSAQFVVRPFKLTSQGLVIVSSIGATGGGPPRVNWQRKGAGALVASSELGVAGANASLPAGFTVVSGDTVIVAEVFYDYVPWLYAGVSAPSRLYHRSLFRPRLGSLTALN